MYCPHIAGSLQFERDADYKARRLPDWQRDEVLLHLFAAGLESGVKLVHRGRIEVRPMTPGCQHEVKRTFQVVVTELERHAVIAGSTLISTMLCVITMHKQIVR